MSRYDSLANSYIIQKDIINAVAYHDIKRYVKRCKKIGYIVKSYYPRRKEIVIYYIRINDKDKIIAYSIIGSKTYTIADLEKMKSEMEEEKCWEQTME